jgi:hypothetical protein
MRLSMLGILKWYEEVNKGNYYFKWVLTMKYQTGS